MIGLFNNYRQQTNLHGFAGFLKQTEVCYVKIFKDIVIH